MEIFNIGPLELVFILVIALIFLGPEDMVKTARKVAKEIRKFIRSPIWKSLIDTSQEIKELPKKFIREAGLEDSIEDLSRLNRFPEEDLKIFPPKKEKSEIDTQTKAPEQANENSEIISEPENKDFDQNSGDKEKDQ